MSSPMPNASYASPAGGAGATPNQSLPGDNFHPTVRVMRLYKPGFHLSPTMPISAPNDTESYGSEFILSSHMLLPDSFGDIYLGEKFTAYIAIVNGFPQVPFHNVSLAVRLQTEATIVELQDTRPSNQIINPQNKASVFPLLSFNDSCDVLIQHTLSELGTHTLRVSVQYSLFPGGEVKSMRKFYRFNVLMPLIVLSSFREIDHKPMVQCQLTNATKSPIFIDEISFVASNKYAEFLTLSKEDQTIVDKRDKNNNTNNATAALATYNEPLQLLPDESFACAFQFTKHEELVGRIVGYPVIRWCSSLGETSVFRGDDTQIRAAQIPTSLLAQPIKFLLEACPAVVSVGDTFEVSIRLLNSTIAPWPLSIDCANYHTDNRHNLDSATLIPPEYQDTTTMATTQNGGGERKPHRGLFYVETIAMEIGNVEGGDFTDLVLSVYAACPGIYDLPPIFAIHSITKEKYHSGRLCTVLVQNPADESESTTVDEITR